MKRGHVPIRQCIVCRGRYPKGELIRFQVLGNGAVMSLRGGETSGRGCYLCRREQCIARGLKMERLARALRRDIVHLPSQEEVLARLV
jgi:predicted RNA-binding protein YlxR (DUF448 family)